MTPTLTRLCAAIATVAAATFPQAAGAAGDVPSGRDCDFVSGNSTGGVPEEYTGQINGGPLFAPGATLTLRCSIHVGNAVHAGPAEVVATAGPSQDVVVLPPEPFTYYAEDFDVVATCTEATVDGTPWYWTGTEWTTDSGASCPTTTTITVPPDGPPDLPPPLDPVEGYLICMWWGMCDPIADQITCDALLAARPGVPGVADVRPDGDLYVLGQFVWDCPPYEVWD